MGVLPPKPWTKEEPMPRERVFEIVDDEQSDFCQTHRMDVTDGEFDYWHEVFDRLADLMIGR